MKKTIERKEYKMTKMISADILRDDLILKTFGTGTEDKVRVIMAIAEEIAEEIGIPTSKNVLIDIANKVDCDGVRVSSNIATKIEGKICSKCGYNLPYSEFHRHEGQLDMKNRICKTCLKLPNNAQRTKEHDKVASELENVRSKILNQVDIDRELEHLARYSYSYSTYQALNQKRLLISKCKEVGFDYTNRTEQGA